MEMISLSRELEQTSVTITNEDCNNVKYSNCFECGGSSLYECSWGNGQCGVRPSPEISSSSTEKQSIADWIEYADGCADAKNICSKEQVAVDGQRKWTVVIESPPDRLGIPQDYYCKFEIDLNDKMEYIIEVDRYKTYLDGQKLDENIEF